MYQLVEGQHQLSEATKELIFPCAFNVTGQDIEDIIVAALEGGIGYWAQLDNTTPDWQGKPSGMPVSLYATQLLLQGHTLVLTDEEDNKGFALTLPHLLKGIGLFVRSGGSIDDVDACGADAIIQYSVFGELVYG